jgi:hypothetical protein
LATPTGTGVSEGRFSGKGIVHYGQYRRLSSEELADIVVEYDDKDQHIGMIGNWEELGFAHYLDWFYEKWSENTGSKAAGILPALTDADSSETTCYSKTPPPLSGAFHSMITLQ